MEIIDTGGIWKAAGGTYENARAVQLAYNAPHLTPHFDVAREILIQRARQHQAVRKGDKVAEAAAIRARKDASDIYFSHYGEMIDFEATFGGAGYVFVNRADLGSNRPFLGQGLSEDAATFDARMLKKYGVSLPPPARIEASPQ